MNSGRLKFIFSRDAGFYMDSFAVRVGRESADGRWAIMQPATFHLPDEKEAVAVERNPAMFMSRDDAQRLMDELWNVGIRPSGGLGSAGQLAAVQAHLRDMQRLVFEPPVRP